MINFPKEEENLSPKDAFIAYEHIADYHLHFLKQQSKCEFLLEGFGCFLLTLHRTFRSTQPWFCAIPFHWNCFHWCKFFVSAGAKYENRFRIWDQSSCLC